MWDIVRFARREGILCQGRGSAANSAVCYCLGITAVDPIKLGLLFERFLSEERTEAPDIDIDFAHRERERVLQYVYERYGREHAAMVCEQITYRGRSAVRDAARVLGFSVEQADALSTPQRPLLREGHGRGAARDAGRAEATRRSRRRARSATTMVPRHRGHHALARREGEGEAGGDADDVGGPPDARTRRTSRTAARMRRAPGDDRTCATHPRARCTRAADRAEPLGGSARDRERRTRERRNPTTAVRATTGGASIVERAGLDPTTAACARSPRSSRACTRSRGIAPSTSAASCSRRSRCATVVPIEPASMPGRTVIQWEKDDLDPVGLVKIDLLGLGMLTLLQDCLLYIRQSARRDDRPRARST